MKSGSLTDKADSGIGSRLALLSSRAEQGSNETHSDRRTSDTGEHELSSTDVIDDSGTWPVSGY